ncbi:ligase-associated DNA damage response endonuclease PdeM [Massilia forsythiae]|uniref:Ligase-associated DNA damage response endonuclease PdeM n=1 Tax=Massilia forsythiae TaxID=2728020 RepID=A0A7Z2VXY8_9BURK|nr:ligase-associated DNA damage response endonuclease PdeM [Massilia forsythiae]QJE01125.1 ligase-associated DNA damage response endonuclease PdeM [Massilia forsythiae]
MSAQHAKPVGGGHDAAAATVAGPETAAAAPAGALAIELAGERVLLLPQKALYWPRLGILAIADIHFGKAAAFRSFGIPVPRGTTTENLEALDALVAATGATHVLFLGDFLHARASHAAATQAAMLAWRLRHPALTLTLVRGNHDQHAGDPAAALGIHLVDEPHTLGPFSFCHHPDIAAPGYALAGHVHPAYRLATRSDTLRLPCFVVGPQRMILPSFGAFTGGYTVRAARGERIFVTSGDAVHSVR